MEQLSFRVVLFLPNFSIPIPDQRSHEEMLNSLRSSLDEITKSRMKTKILVRIKEGK